MRRAFTAAIVAALDGRGPGRGGGDRPPTAAEIARETDQLSGRTACAPGPRAGGSGGIGETFGGDLLPANRIVAFYGAPQMGQTVLGTHTVAGAARALATQTEPYEELGDRPVVGEFDLVSVFATAGGGRTASTEPARATR